MYTTSATIENAYGIHVRPSGVISQALTGYTGKVTITSQQNGAQANPASVLSLLSLGLACGDSVTISVEGPDEKQTAEMLAELFARHFDFKR